MASVNTKASAPTPGNGHTFYRNFLFNRRSPVQAVCVSRWIDPSTVDGFVHTPTTPDAVLVEEMTPYGLSLGLVRDPTTKKLRKQK